MRKDRLKCKQDIPRLLEASNTSIVRMLIKDGMLPDWLSVVLDANKAHGPEVPKVRMQSMAMSGLHLSPASSSMVHRWQGQLLYVFAGSARP